MFLFASVCLSVSVSVGRFPVPPFLSCRLLNHCVSTPGSDVCGFLGILGTFGRFWIITGALFFWTNSLTNIVHNFTQGVLPPSAWMKTACLFETSGFIAKDMLLCAPGTRDDGTRLGVAHQPVIVIHLPLTFCSRHIWRRGLQEGPGTAHCLDTWVGEGNIPVRDRTIKFLGLLESFYMLASKTNGDVSETWNILSVKQVGLLASWEATWGLICSQFPLPSEVLSFSELVLHQRLGQGVIWSIALLSLLS